MIVLSRHPDLPHIPLSLLQFEWKSSALQKVMFLSSDLSLKTVEQDHANVTTRALGIKGETLEKYTHKKAAQVLRV